MQVPGSDMMWPELMSEGKKNTFREEESILFISEWTFSLKPVLLRVNEEREVTCSTHEYCVCTL